MHRCFVRQEQWQSDLLPLAEEEAHHLLNVMRAKPGDPVLAFDGCGQEAEAIVASLSPPTLKLTEPIRAVSDGMLLTLIQCLPKGKRMDLIVEKTTELGVHTIVPTLSDRVISRPTPDKLKSKCERWQRLATSAARQCGTTWIPRIIPVPSYEKAMHTSGPFDLLFIGSLAPKTPPLSAALAECRKVITDAAQPRVGVIIGPEGDLTPDELHLAQQAGARPVSFGARVLRVETAALYIVSVLAYEYG